MKAFSEKKTATNIILACLLILGAVLRLIDITDPPLVFHPTRQLRSTLIARDIYYQLLPDADPEKQELASKFTNGMGIYEPPIFESIVGWTYLWAGGESIVIPRIYNTFFWLLAGLALFQLARCLSSDEAALVAIAFFLILPFGVEASRSFQPDPLMTSLFVGGFYFLYRWTEEESWKYAILSAFFLGFATLVKISIVFFVAPIAVVAVFIVYGWKNFWKSPQVWAIFLLMVLPAFIYYIFGIQETSSSFFLNRTLGASGLLLDSKFYLQWMRLTGSLFSTTIIFFSLVGVLLLPSRGRALLIGIWTGYILYGLALPYFIHTHSYYHIQLIPTIALGIAPIAQGIITQVRRQGRFVGSLFIGLALLALAYNAWVARSVLLARDFRVEAIVWKNIADEIPANRSIIALTQDYGNRLMVFGWRDVALWPLSTLMQEMNDNQINVKAEFERRTEGKDFFLITAFGQYNKQPLLKEILSDYPLLGEDNDDFLLFDLR
ncbi:MAG: hypothetical protein HN392_02820 [Anaerolineae bacterium]|jgi:hypothetical protein|nr:hypothetical protein [Anaerolineae bacterium]MBT7074120.1 hypothetical protein [Anaerolineae bacterium]MBT7781351.1 hypothetical protein [Anaerolineae bacterium]